MKKYEAPDFDELDRRDRMVARLGGVGVQDNIADGIGYAFKANEAYGTGDQEQYDEMIRAASILIGKKSLGSLELNARVFRRDLGPSPTETDYQVALGMETIAGRFVGLIDKPDQEIMAMTTDELLLETARGMHRMKQEPSVLPPMELWNRQDVMEESLISGRLHPWVAWSARGTADDIDLASPLYAEFIHTDLRIGLLPDPLLEIDNKDEI